MYNDKPREGTEAYRVLKEVEKRKKIAENKGVDELITNLYFNEIQYWPSWIHHENRGEIPMIVKSAISNSGDNFQKENITIILNNKNYTFKFNENWDDGYGYSTINLYSDNKKVFTVSASGEYTEYGTNWIPNNIKAFIDGSWINDFRLLKEEIKKDKKVRAQKRAEDEGHVEEMKNNFGIL